jgi:dephospho-CoA kinase/uncharacterized protein YjgD (DUF1641 family)
MSLSEKYKPKFQKQLLINPPVLLSDIKSWEKSLDKNSKQILCVIGPIGCGKSIAIDVLFKNYNKLVIDIESSKQNEILDSIVSYKEQTFHNTSKNKNVVIIENIEYSEKQIVLFIDKVHHVKNISVPIVLLSNNTKSNDTFKEITTPILYCKFEYPTEEMFLEFITYVNKNEKLQLNINDMRSIILKSTGDFRQLFAILDSWRLQLKVNSTIKFDDFNSSVSVKYKDVDLIDKLEYLVNEQSFDFEKSYLLSSAEAYSISLGIYQNYPSQENLNCDLLSQISDVLSYSNVINNQIYNHQCWELYDDYSMTGCIIPSFLIKQSKLNQIEIKQFKDVSYNFENSLNEIKMMILENNYQNKIFKSDLPYNTFTNISSETMFMITNTIISCIETVNHSFDGLKKGKNTSKKEKLELANTITDPKVKKSFDYLIDIIFNYRLFELDWKYLRLNISQLQEEKEMIEYYEKIDLRIFKRLINIFSLSKTNKLLKSHTETALKFNLCKKIITEMKNLNHTTIINNNIEDMTQSLESIWNF